ncbi:ABC transporter substrate-binding protein [Actinomyces timonensis]|uniref:ABC transporter substrate-binding protein n=1 Tax=Actinomyces timonensis TaxID=1288391 RepID=UPI0002F9F9E4|nr:ABC transporter substrate-binding protein [Actinomyces timonensis]
MTASPSAPSPAEAPSAAPTPAAEGAPTAQAPADAPVTSDNAADILAADDSADELAAVAKRSTTRRGLLIGGSVAAAALVAGGAWLTLRRTNQGVVGAAEEIPLVIGGDICAAPLYAAYHQGYFDDAGLNVTLVRTQQTEDTKDGVGAGKYIGAPGIFFSWLEPIYNGLNARLTAGLHAGCLRVVAPEGSSYSSLADLKGASIGVPSLSSSAFAYFSIGLSDAGINPDPSAGDISWRTIDSDSLGQSLTSGDVDVIMGSDPGVLLPVLAGTGHEIANNDAEQFCCSVVLNGDFVSKQPERAKALTEAWLKGSAYVPDHIEEIAKLEVDNEYVATEQDVVQKVLRTYGFDASATRFRAAIEPGIERFKKTGFISADVEAGKLADAVYADLGISQ